MTVVHTLKSGKTFTVPSIFVMPQSPHDATALWRVDGRKGLTHIDGLYFKLVNFKSVFSRLGFSSKPLFEETESTLRDKIRLIDPSLKHLLTGMEEDKQSMLSTGLFDNRLGKIIRDITNSGLSVNDKISKFISEVYLRISVRPIIEYQLKHGVDIIISPCINLSSRYRLHDRIAIATTMLQNTRILLDTSSLKKYKETRDLMNVVSISRSVLVDERNFHSIFDLLLCNNPDHVGIEIEGVTESDTVAYEIAFRFFRQFHEYAKIKTGNKPPPIHFINVNELGYASFCSGICNIVSPIARSPSFAFGRKRNSTKLSKAIDTSETYYHPIDMNTPHLKTLNPLPCACTECVMYVNATGIPRIHRPLFRRTHWLHVKDGEIRELRETPARLDIALKDKFARSMRTQLIAYLPASPLFTIY